MSQIKTVSSIRYFCLDEYRLGSRKILKNLFVKRRKSIIVSKLVFACININVNQRDTLTKCIINRTLSNVEIFSYRLYMALKLFPVAYGDKSMHMFLYVSSAFIHRRHEMHISSEKGGFYYNHKTCKTRMKYI